MKKKLRRNLILRYALITLAVLWMGVIFYFSSQTGGESAAASEKVTSGISNIIKPPGFNDMAPGEQAGFIYELNIVIRNNAHKIIYFILAALIFCALLTFSKINLILKLFITYFFCIFYAAADELHQYFVPGRNGSVGDVIKDMHGVTAALISAFIIYSVFFLFKNKLKLKTTNY